MKQGSNHLLDVEEYLKLICYNCEKANGRCIKDDVYVGLCAKTDREELIELYEYKNRNRR